MMKLMKLFFRVKELILQPKYAEEGVLKVVIANFLDNLCSSTVFALTSEGSWTMKDPQLVGKFVW